MGNAHVSLLIALAFLGCKRDSDPAPPDPAPAAPGSAASRNANAAPADAGHTWYRAAVRAQDGIEASFLLGVPAPGTAGKAIFKAGSHEVQNAAVFDGKTLKIPMTLYQTAVDATVGADGTLSGTFSTTWRAWGASSIALTGTKVAGPAAAATATGSGGAAIDLSEARSVWRVVTKESGTAKLVINQIAPGDFEGVLSLDTGNIIYVAGSGRGDAMVLTGFDGTAGYRLELALGADRKSARGKFFAGQRFDWRETLTAARGADFELEIKARAERPRGKIGLPDVPELAALEPGPLVVEIAGSWCATCRHAAPVLVDLHREFQPRGLRMVTLLYEFSDDPASDAQQAAAFKQTYGITWPVVPIAGGVDEFTSIIPSGVTDLNPAGFPITLFLAADRSLVALHAGFPAADATAPEHRRAVAEFRGHIETALQRSRPAPRKEKR